jgi:hypothetical protein
MKTNRTDLFALMRAENPADFLRNNRNNLFVEYPVFERLNIVDTINGLSHKNNWKHSLVVLEKACKISDDPVFRFSALMHDVGKAKCKKFDSERGWQFDGHAKAGAKYTLNYCNDLGYLESIDIERIYTIISLHQDPIELNIQSANGEIITDSALRRFAMKCESYLKDIYLFCQCDITTSDKNKEKIYIDNIHALFARIQIILENDKKAQWRPSFNGKDLMDQFGLESGRFLGEVKDVVIRAIKNGEIEDKKEICLEFAKNYIKKYEEKSCVL